MHPMRKIHLLLTDMKRAVFSMRFLLSVVGVAMVMYMAISRMGEGMQSASVWYLMYLSISGSGIVSTTLCLFPVFAFGLSYASEWQQKAEKYWIIRTGTESYVWSKTVVCYLSGFLTVFCGMVLFVLLMSLFYPLYTGNINSIQSGDYEILAAKGHVLAAYLLYMIHNALSGSIMATCALCFSSVLPNTFCTATAPMLLYFVLLRVTTRLSLPGWLDPLYWNGGIYYADTVHTTLFIKVVTSVVVGICFGCFSKRNIERRLMNE